MANTFILMLKLFSFLPLALAVMPVWSTPKLNYYTPLPQINTLAGSYAELRPNHFHGGWDFRTGGQCGLPVRSLADGYIARVVITPSGYGKMVMINHPDGTTTVYGHLEGFVGRLDSFVRAIQYQRQRYDVTIEFKPTDFPIRGGQQFAFSGNTGGSAGPHLHFETRRTSDGTMLNPFLHNNVFGIQDKMAPTIFGIKIYAVPGQGSVNGVSQMRYLTNIRRATLRQGSSVRAWGKITFGIKSSDQMTGSWFHYGIRKVRLFVDDKLFSEVNIQNFRFADKRAVNSLVDFEQLMLTKEYYVKFSREKGNPLPFYSHAPSNAILNVNRQRNYRIRMETIDDFGNANSFSFNVRGVPSTATPAPHGYSSMLRQGVPNSFSRKSLLLSFPKDALYTNVPLYYSESPSLHFFSRIYDFGVKYVPFHTKIDVSVKIDRDSLHNKNQYVLASLNNRNLVNGIVPATYVKGFMVGQTYSLPRMAVFKDAIKPTIVVEHINKLRTFPVMKFKIHDNLSGIDTYNGFIDGHWVLFEYDPKNARISCDLRLCHLQQFRNHNLKLVVTDACKNAAVYQTKIYF